MEFEQTIRNTLHEMLYQLHTDKRMHMITRDFYMARYSEPERKTILFVLRTFGDELSSVDYYPFEDTQELLSEHYLGYIRCEISKDNWE